MEFDSPLLRATLVRRYQRFLADVVLASGEAVTVHCPNTGTMATCADPAATIYLSQPPSRKTTASPRKYPYRWELTETLNGYIGINTQRANAIVENGLRMGLIPELRYSTIKREAAIGKTRFDFLLTGAAGERTWVEVKNATLLHNGAVKFPDAVTERGRKHLVELAARVREGDRAVMLFLVNRPEGAHVAAADHIDPQYAAELARAKIAGVKILAYRAVTDLAGSRLGGEVPIVVG